MNDKLLGEFFLVVGILSFILIILIVRDLIRIARIKGPEGKYRRKYMFRGVALIVLGHLTNPWHLTNDITSPLFIFSVVAILFGCAHVAQAKGRNNLWGLLGLLPFFGVAIVFVLDEYKIPTLE